MKILIVNTAYWPEIIDFGLLDEDTKALPLETLAKMTGSGSALAQYFRTLGVEASYMIANAPSSGLRDSKSRIGLLCLRYWQIISRLPIVGQFIHLWAPISRELERQVREQAPDVLYCLNPNLLPPALAKKLSRKTKLVGQIASPLPRRSYFQHYKMMISALPSHVAQFRSWGLRAEYLPLSIDQELLVSTPLPLSDRAIDISFVGSFSRHHKNSFGLIKSVALEFPQLRIFTPSPKVKLERLGLGQNYAGPAWGERMRQIYSNSKIVINRHGAVANGFAVNYRMFEATGCGALLATEDAPNLGDLFPENTVLAYSSTNDLIEKIREVLANPREFEAKATAAWLSVNSRHTLQERSRDVLELLSKL